jgi:pyruvoyl-dependent arginine decarboxylase (PvlArgDC)
VRLLRIAGTTVGVVGEHPDDVAAFERALVQTRAALQGAPLV